MKSAGKGKLKKIIIWAVVALAVILFVVVPIFGPLNPLEVLLLRIKYPVYSSAGRGLPNAEPRDQVNVVGAAMYSDTILHIRITGDEDEFGLTPYGYYWTAEVIEDPSGKSQPGEAISIKLYEAYANSKYPQMQPGSEYLVMGWFGEENENEFYAQSLGIFYVTFSGHALASADEGSLSLSGKKVDVCMDTAYQFIQENAE